MKIGLETLLHLMRNKASSAAPTFAKEARGWGSIEARECLESSRITNRLDWSRNEVVLVVVFEEGTLIVFALVDPEEFQSRGALVKAVLYSSQEELKNKFFTKPVGEWNVQTLPGNFDGFNFVGADLFAENTDVLGKSVFFVSNRRQHYLPPEVKPSDEGKSDKMSLPNQAETCRVPMGVHCVSNRGLNDERWPKVKHLRARLAQTIRSFGRQGWKLIFVLVCVCVCLCAFQAFQGLNPRWT